MKGFFLAIGLSSVLWGQTADSIFYGGEIITVHEAMPSTEAVAVLDGKILFVGTKEAAFAYQGEKTQSFDLKGGALLPGFIDAHTQMMLEALLQTGVDVSPFRFQTVGQVIRVLKRAAKKGPVLAFGYDSSLMTRPGVMGFDLLDRVSKEVPILVLDKSGRFAYGNHKAFELAKISEETKNPFGGAFQRNAAGSLVGVAEEAPALAKLFTPMAMLLELDYKALAKQAAQIYAKQGYTTVTDLSLGAPMPTPRENIRIFQELAASSECPVRIQGYASHGLLNRIPSLQEANTDRFKILGIKLWADGSLQGYTAALKEPYKNRQTSGNLNFSQEQLSGLILAAHQQNLQVAVQANGDLAIEETLQAFEQAQSIAPREDARFRIEHATVVDAGQWNRIAALKASASFTVEHIYYWGKVFKNTILGESRAGLLDAVKTAKDLGIKYSFNDDAVASINPLFLMQIALNRKMQSGGILNPEERISVDEAIQAMTLYPAWQSFREKELGSIEVGKLADFVWLDQSPKRVHLDKIKDIKILGTWIDGKKVELN